MRITIGIPAFNEEKNIASIITKLRKISDSIIICNDGSSDMTEEIAKEMGVIVISHEKNLGYGAAIRSLFEKAREMELDSLITFDGDNQHRIEDINSVFEPINEGSADIVIGSRFLNERTENVPTYRKAGIRLITKVTNLSIKEKLTDSQSGFRGYNKKALKKIQVSDEGMGVSTEILIKGSNLGLKIVEVPIKVNYEGETSTHHPVSHGTSVIVSTLKFTSISHPLKFWGIPGIVLLGFGFIFMFISFQNLGYDRDVFTNYALVGIGGLILGSIMMMTAAILYTIVSVVREK
jgi:glycosyltransferase involved in cell wall biosynthesis